MKKNLDIQIIWKKKYQKLTALEEEQLSDWMKDDQERADFYKNATSFFASGSKIRKENINVSKAKRKVWYKIFILPRLKSIYRVAAVVFLIVSLGAISMELYRNFQTRESAGAIKPCEAKATLILSDGSRHSLEKWENNELKEKGALIVNSGKELNYETLPTTNKLRQKDLSERFNTLKIPRGGEYILKLSDGTKVWLNSETVLTYPLQFDKNERKVELIGEAFFEVKHNPAKPFKVEIKGQVIEVLGTSFNVNAYPDKYYSATTLADGSVKVKINGTGNTVLLEPGFQCQVNKSDKNYSVSKVNVRKVIAWRYGNYMFEDETLENMISTLSRWYDFTYSFENEKSRQLKFTGKLKRTDKFEDILTIIENTNEVKFKVEEKRVIIY